jgi:hypothetical protein
MLALAVVLVARHVFVPGHLMLEAHLESALVASDMRIHVLCVVVELTVLAGIAEAPPEVGIGRQMIEEKVMFIARV